MNDPMIPTTPRPDVRQLRRKAEHALRELRQARVPEGHRKVQHLLLDDLAEVIEAALAAASAPEPEKPTAASPGDGPAAAAETAALRQQVETLTAREAELHDLVTWLWSVTDTDDADLMMLVHDVLGANNEGQCGNRICAELHSATQRAEKAEADVTRLTQEIAALRGQQNAVAEVLPELDLLREAYAISAAQPSWPLQVRSIWRAKAGVYEDALARIRQKLAALAVPSAEEQTP